MFLFCKRSSILVLQPVQKNVWVYAGTVVNACVFIVVTTSVRCFFAVIVLFLEEDMLRYETMNV